MTQTEMEDAIKNLDRRLVSVEQILPTLATREDLLATRVDLRAELLATRRDLHDEIVAVRRELIERIEEGRRHTDVLFEDVRDDIRKVAEGVATLTAVVHDQAARSDRQFRKIDRRFDALTARLDQR